MAAPIAGTLVRMTDDVLLPDLFYTLENWFKIGSDTATEPDQEPVEKPDQNPEQAD